MHRLLISKRLLTLRQDHFRNKKNFFVPSPLFIDFKNSNIFTQFKKNYPIRNLWWLFPERLMHQLQENMFLLTLRQDHFCNKKILSVFSPIYRVQKRWYFHSIQEKRHYQTHVEVLFRDTCAPTSRKYVPTDPETRSFQ